MQQEKRSFESSLHDIVYSIDTGTGLKIIRVALYALMVIMVVLIYTATQFRGLRTEEAMDYAQLGRNMTVSEGMVTKCLRPITMWHDAQRSPNGVPTFQGHKDVLHPPAYPAFLWLGFRFYEMIGVDPFALSETGSRILPAEQWVVLPANHFFAVMTGFLVFLLGKRLFSREIGFIGMTIYYFSDVVWQNSLSAVGISMASFFIVASFHSMAVAMLNRRDKESTVSWLVPFLISVVCAAAAVLTRYIAAAALPGIVLFAWLMAGKFRGGTRYALVFTLLVALLVSPWLYRNIKVSGNPLGLAAHTALVDTAKYPDKTFDRSLNPEFSFSQTTNLLKEKWISNFSSKYSTVVPGMGGGIIMALFLVTFFYHFVRPQVNYLRWGLGVSLLLMLIIAGFFSSSSVAMLHAFWPFAILYGLAFYKILLDRLDIGVRLYTTGLKVLIVGLSMIPFFLTILPPHATKPYPPYETLYISYLSDLLSPREIMCTDMPWATAWYGDRISVLLPQNVDDFFNINDNQRNMSGLYITALTMNKPFVKDLLVGQEKSWMPLLNAQPPAGFPLKALFRTPNVPEMLFYSDRDRWATRSTDKQ